jgi:hypothetical protein
VFDAFTEDGVMWLEIQYGKGTIIGHGPIELPVIIND